MVVFRDGPSNAANHIFPRPTPIAMAMKFGTKLAITWLMSVRFFASVGKFSEMGHQMVLTEFYPYRPKGYRFGQIAQDVHRKTTDISV